MADISNFQDDELDYSLSADVPLTSTPLRSGVPQDTHSLSTSSPLVPSFSLIDDATDQSESRSTDNPSDDEVDDPGTDVHPDNEWFGYKFLGDNVDGKVTPRFMRSDNQSKEFHYFHQYAVRDRVDMSHLSEEPPSIDPDVALHQLIPTAEDNAAMLTNFSMLVTREIVQHMPFFAKNFSDVIVSHIPHTYSKEMARKSEIVSY